MNRNSGITWACGNGAPSTAKPETVTVKKKLTLQDKNGSRIIERSCVFRGTLGHVPLGAEVALLNICDSPSKHLKYTYFMTLHETKRLQMLQTAFS